MERRRLLFALMATLLALPLLMIDSIAADGSPRSGDAAVVAGDGASQAGSRHARVGNDPTNVVQAQLDAAAAAPVTEATAPPTEAPPSTEQAAPVTTSAPRAAPTPTAPPPTHAAPPDTVTPIGPPPEEPTAGSTQEGQASWYYHDPGTCAHRSLPFGTVVTVTSLRDGATTTCTVADRGPYIQGRIIDLERSVFAELADPSVGVLDVRISW